MSTFPSLALADWKPTRDTVEMYTKLLGRVRRAMAPKNKHWWHVSLHVSGCGLTTTPFPVGSHVMELMLDFTTHQLLIISSKGDRCVIPLHGQSPKQFHDEVLVALAALGCMPEIDHSLFANDKPGTYDKTAVSRYWQALCQIDAALKTFKGGFRGESSPVQFWPHHFDLALVWFSGRLCPGQDPNDPEWADEQINFGFSTGDDSLPNPYFYAVAYPRPDGFVGSPLPEDAYWHQTGWTGAMMLYEKLETAENPTAKLLNFYQAAHQIGANLMK